MDDMTSSPTLVPASSSVLSPSVPDVRKEHRKTYDPWDSDLSELTPLEDSSSESEDETPVSIFYSLVSLTLSLITNIHWT